MPTVTYNVSHGASLASGGSGTNYVINITSGTINLAELYAVNLTTGDCITVSGNSATLEGAGTALLRTARAAMSAAGSC
jgi:hypothetical protein